MHNKGMRDKESPGKSPRERFFRFFRKGLTGRVQSSGKTHEFREKRVRCDLPVVVKDLRFKELLLLKKWRHRGTDLTTYRVSPSNSFMND